jgi:hypothetical protein
MRLSKAILIFMLTVGTSALAAGPSISGCPVFPEDHIFNTPIDTLPVHASSTTWINTMGAAGKLHPDFGSSYGIPYLLTSNSPMVNASFAYVEDSDPGPYPIPLNAPIEGGSASTGDRHVLVLDKGRSKLYEMFSSYPSSNAWSACSGAVFDMKGYALRTETYTSADAAGLPILPLLVRYDEIASGEIKHAIRFTAPKTKREYLWPARHYASTITSTAYPPMGARLRLKASYDISHFDATNQVILRALKKYGMILADNGSAWYITGVPDARFVDTGLDALKTITGSSFEVVDCSYLMINKDSGAARSPTPVFRSVSIKANSYVFGAELLPKLPHTIERRKSSTGTWSVVESFTPTNSGITIKTYPFDPTTTWFYRVKR